MPFAHDDALKNVTAIWLAIVRLVALSCLGVHALILIRNPDAVGVVMAAVSAWCLWHAGRVDGGGIGHASAGLAAGGLVMALAHLLLTHRPHDHMEHGLMDMSGGHQVGLIAHLGVSLAAGQLLLGGLGAILHLRRSAG